MFGDKGDIKNIKIYDKLFKENIHKSQEIEKQ